MARKSSKALVNRGLLTALLFVSAVVVSFVLGRISNQDSTAFAKRFDFQSYAGCGTPDPARTDMDPPVVKITNPTDGTMASKSTAVHVDINATDSSSMTKAELWINGALYGIGPANPGDPTASFNVNLPNKPGVTHKLQAKVCDSARNYGESSVVSVTTTN